MPTETLTVPRPGLAEPPMQAYLARPEGNGPFAGVIVIHELYGLNENIRGITRRFAEAGYVGLAVDLFSGVRRAVCLVRLFSGVLLRPLRNGTLTELQSALDVLHSRPEVDARRVGVIGFCMGGSYALQLACVDGSLRAASVFYGQNPRPLEAASRACPIVGSYPAQDFTARGARKLAEALRRYDVPHDIRIYPGTRHSFFNDNSRNHAPEAAADSWQRTLAFFEHYLA